MGTSQNKAKEVVLMPLVSRREDNEAFVHKVCSNADEVVVLLVVDTAAMPGGFGFAASEIAHGNELMQEIKQMVEARGRQCIDVMEWGSTATKIQHLVELQKIKKIFLVKQDNHFFRQLVKDLKEATGTEIETVTVSEEE